MAGQSVSRCRGGHPVGHLLLQVRTQSGLVRGVRAGIGTAAVRPRHRRAVRDPRAHPVRHRGDHGRFRRDHRSVDRHHRIRRDRHRPVPDQLPWRAVHPGHARAARPGELLGEGAAISILGPRLRPDRQAGRHHRHRSHRHPDHPHHRTRRRAFDRGAAHGHLGVAQTERADPRPPAWCVPVRAETAVAAAFSDRLDVRDRRDTRRGLQQAVARHHEGNGEALPASPAGSGQGPRVAHQTHPALRLRLQASVVLQRLFPHVQPRHRFRETAAP